MMSLILALFLLPLFLGVITNAEILATTIAGLVAPFLIEGLKRFDRKRGKRARSRRPELLKGRAAFIATLILSILITIFALMLSGEVNSLADVYRSSLMVLGIATGVYKLLLADKSSAARSTSKRRRS